LWGDDDVDEDLLVVATQMAEEGRPQGDQPPTLDADDLAEMSRVMDEDMEWQGEQEEREEEAQRFNQTQTVFRDESQPLVPAAKPVFKAPQALPKRAQQTDELQIQLAEMKESIKRLTQEKYQKLVCRTLLTGMH